MEVLAPLAGSSWERGRLWRGQHENMPKLHVLTFIEQQGEATPVDVAGYFGWTIPGSGSTLLRLHRHGHLRRRRTLRQRVSDRRRWEFAGFVYRISDKGLRYLEWAERSE